eukprot:TRINITY_DN4042_c0_g1_i1.p1 TRINITY_DN4042_c0_g1~~TRINITY_DN4042_c0_g1_i1.p1  ORF type:complete len:333 (+),score=10.00 TRINITY_DN4042_c0_g1_i1:11-1009(+)
MHLYWFCFLICVGHVLTAPTCGSRCRNSTMCQASASNTCTFCEENECVPMCGVGCRSNHDCQGGGSPCTQCSSRLTCTNPNSQATCGTTCVTDTDCKSNPANKCTFCQHYATGWKCAPMCGVGCRTDSDCQGAANPCSVCNSQNICANPAPQCGSFCGGQASACRANGAKNGKCGGANGQCCKCSENWNEGCVVGTHNNCGHLCSGTAGCANTTSTNCTQCVGYHCSVPQKCGQNCIGNGQCQNNPAPCTACIGTLCTHTHACGGSCGNDGWCSSECPVCGYAVCKSGEAWKAELEEHQHELEEFLARARQAREHVHQLYQERTRMQLLGHP